MYKLGLCGGGKNLYASVGNELSPETSLRGFESVRSRFLAGLWAEQAPPSKVLLFFDFSKSPFLGEKVSGRTRLLNLHKSQIFGPPIPGSSASDHGFHSRR